MKKLRRFVRRALALLLAGTLGLSMAPEMTARAAGTESVPDGICTDSMS